MIDFPMELIKCTFIDDNGNRQLKDDATESQKKIFKNFYNSFNEELYTEDEFSIED